MNTTIDDIDDILRQKRESRANARPPRKRMTWKRQLLRAGLIIGLGYIGIIVFLMANETFLVYPGSKYPKGNWQPENFNYEEVQFNSKDGTKLYGWYLHRPVKTDQGDTKPNQSGEVTLTETDSQETVAFNDGLTFLHCHGNAENIAEVGQYSGDRFRQTFNADLFTFDYRGFGKSEGTPFEAGVLEDSEAAFQWLCEKTNKQPTDISLIGHSLGGGPAVHLAKKYGCRLIILQRTYSSISDAGQKQYPWLPVRMLMRNQFHSAEKIKDVSAPLFQSHGDADRLIPIELGKQVFDNSPTTNKKFVAVKGMTHWDPLPQNYWTELITFVDSIESGESK